MQTGLLTAVWAAVELVVYLTDVSANTVVIQKFNYVFRQPTGL